MRILLVGASGQIGGELRHLLAPLGPLFTPTSDQMDLLQPETWQPFVEHARPDWIINAAAYTSVDAAETNRHLAFALNADAPGNLAKLATNFGAAFIHFSTDYVFDGSKDQPYAETDPTCPINAYGESKAAGEECVRNANARHLIFRTSWVYSQRRTNFFLTMERLLQERAEVRVVADQYGAPTKASNVAAAVVHALQEISRPGGRLNGTPVWGTYHLTCAGRTSWYGFADAIREHLVTPKAELTPVSSIEYGAQVHRPKNAVLSNSKFHETFQFSMPLWRVSLEQLYCTRDDAK